MSSYYSQDELAELGLKQYGEDVKISRKTSLYNPEEIELGDNVRIDDFCLLSGDINIGSHVHIAPFCGLWGKEGIELADFTGLSSRVSIYSSRDDFSGESLTNPTIPEKYKPEIHKGEVILKKHVVIGASSVILPDVKIGKGAAVGALSLVRDGKVPPWEIHFGIPARCILDRRKKPILHYEEEFLEEYHSN